MHISGWMHALHSNNTAAISTIWVIYIEEVVQKTNNYVDLMLNNIQLARNEDGATYRQIAMLW